MKKMRNRWLCALLVMAMLLNLTACGVATKEEKPQETEPAKQESEQIAEPEEQPKETPEPEETETIVPEEKTVPLNVSKISLGCQYTESVNDEWYSVETMQDFFLLEDESAKDYPKLAKSLEDYKNENESTIETTMGSLMEYFTDSVTDRAMGVSLSDKTMRSVLRADQSYFSFLEQNGS